MKTDVIIPTRFQSERLPGKCLIDMGGGLPNLYRIIRRSLLCGSITHVILAIPEGPEQDPIREFYNEKIKTDPLFVSVKLYEGDPEDVVKRTIKAAETFGTEIIVDVTHDCTFISWEIMTLLIKMQSTFDLDYCSNVMTRSYPDGMDIQVYPLSSIKEVDKIIPEKSNMRYHTGWNIVHYKEQLKNYHYLNLEAPSHLNYPKWRIVLDEPADYKVLHKISEYFMVNYGIKYEPSFFEIMEYIKSTPGILTNRNVRTKEVEEG